MDREPGRELLTRYEHNPILSARDWPYKVNAVFNAAAVEIQGQVLLLVRVEDFRGISHLTVARSANGVSGWHIDPQPTLSPDPENHPEEIWGIEDPRITWIAEIERWAICYTAYSKSGPLVSLATTADFRSPDRLGPVMPPEDKDAALFPVRFKELWAMLHRPVPRSSLLGAHIWPLFSPDLRHWGGHQEIIHTREGAWWDANKIGLCAPPLTTPHGWLILYHGVRTAASGSIYRLGLALLDREGDVDDVIFPCGWFVREGVVYMYYGAADSCIALATASLSELIDFILRCPESDM